MKFSNFFKVALMATAVTFSLSACGDDDDNDSEDNGGFGGAGTEAPDLSQLGVTHPVLSISRGYGDNVYNEEEGPFMSFNYSNGRMTGGTYDNGTGFTISSNPLRFDEYEDYGDGTYWRAGYSNLKVNESGYVTYADVRFEEAERDEEDGTLEVEVGTGHWSFTYDGEGHLTGESYNVVWNDGYSENGESTITWNNGNMVSYEAKGNDSEGDVYADTYTWTYGTGRFNTGVFWFYPYESINEAMYLWYTGFFGKPSREVPSSVTESDNGYSSTQIIDATYNLDGSIAKLEYKYDENSSGESFFFNYGGANRSLVKATPAKKSAANSPVKRMRDRMKNRRK